MEKSILPPISKELIDDLEKRFPDVMPDHDDNVELIRFKSGQVSVVRFLKYQFHLQNQTILES